MKFAYHFGAHCTDEDRLLKCLLKNQSALASRGINVTGPGHYRSKLRNAVNTLRGTAAPAELQQDLLDSIVKEAMPDRVVFSNSAFFSSASAAAGMGRLYPEAGEFARSYAQLFPDDETEFFFAIRDPASFFPAIFSQSEEQSFENFLLGTDPRTTRWSDTIERIRRATPNVPLTVWCNEDSPVIWHDILNRIAGIGPDLTLRGSYDFPAGLLEQAGIDALAEQLRSGPPKTAEDRRHMLAASLERYAKPDQLEEEINLPNWSQDLMDELSELYDADLERIGQIDGVTLLTP